MADRNNNGLYFIVGGIVVAVALLFYVMSGTRTGTATTDPVAGGDTNVVVEDNSVDVPAVGVETDSPEAVESPAEPLAPVPAN
ncbi:MAG: hypothetical protein VX878_15390 [Pseudomonadota bacterium]|uniref:hypothetical protein n=1 Tax=Paracoccus sp. TaxID=267 RepID=UPI002EACB7B0|nr:hypothetical protein [Pseudomonadota bacterium]